MNIQVNISRDWCFTHTLKGTGRAWETMGERVKRNIDEPYTWVFNPGFFIFYPFSGQK